MGPLAAPPGNYPDGFAGGSVAVSIPFPLHPVFEGGTLLADPFRCKTDTQILKSKGDTVNLRSIRDGRDKDAVAKREVILSNFLEREPENCGSRLSLAPSR
jgi:hypothetical protein